MYSEIDINEFIKFYYREGKQTNKDLGIIASLVAPSVIRYKELEETERYEFRRNIRNLIKWYNSFNQL